MAASTQVAKPGRRKRQAQTRRASRAAQASKARREAENGEKNPRSVRYQMTLGNLVFRNGAPPVAPQEWSKVKQNRLQRCLDAAILFLKNKEHEEIAEAMGLTLRKTGDPIEPHSVTKQRLAQLVVRGVGFFLQTGFVMRKV